jgi:serine/threonine protein kinase
MDATRMSDKKFVFLKAIKKTAHPFETEIGLFFSHESMSSDPRNHCVPIYEVVQLPDDKDTVILVMPLLKEFYFPWFETVGEVVEFIRQVFEVRKRFFAWLDRAVYPLPLSKGLQFMHKHNVAHR